MDTGPTGPAVDRGKWEGKTPRSWSSQSGRLQIQARPLRLIGKRRTYGGGTERVEAMPLKGLMAQFLETRRGNEGLRFGVPPGLQTVSPTVGAAIDSGPVAVCVAFTALASALCLDKLAAGYRGLRCTVRSGQVIERWDQQQPLDVQAMGVGEHRVLFSFSLF